MTINNTFSNEYLLKAAGTTVKLPLFINLFIADPDLNLKNEHVWQKLQYFFQSKRTEPGLLFQTSSFFFTFLFKD